VNDISVFVQSVEGRPCWEHAQAAIEVSDIGTRYARRTHPPGCSYAEFIQDVFAEMAQVSTEYVLRFEDDVSAVNTHILHNVLTWPVLQQERFGVGYLFDPGGLYSERSQINMIYHEYGREGWHAGGVTRSFAVVFRTEDLVWLRPYIWQYMQTHSCFDLSLGEAMAERERGVCVHAPSLVEHDASVPSLLGHAEDQHSTSGGTFRQEWRRE